MIEGVLQGERGRMVALDQLQNAVVQLV